MNRLRFGGNLNWLRNKGIFPAANRDFVCFPAMQRTRIIMLAFISFALLLGSARHACSQIALANVGHTTNDGSAYNAGIANGVAVSGNYVYLANEADGLRIYDISNPANPINVGHTNILWPGATNNFKRFYGLAMSGNYAYVTDVLELFVLDVSTAASPVVVGEKDIPFKGGGVSAQLGCGIAVQSNYVYLANRQDGLRIFSVSNPTNPINVGYVTDYGGFFGNARGVALAGNHAYLANGPDGLRIYDVSNPAIPINVGYANDGGYAQGVSVSGDHAYLADSQDGLRIYDISNPANPMSIGHADNGGSAYFVAVSGNFAYVANTNDGLRVYDVSDPSSPISIGQSATNYNAVPFGVAVAGNHAYLANGADGLRIFAVEPQLGMSRTSTNTILFSWPAPAAFRLQQNSDLTTTNWGNLTNLPTAIGAWDQLIVSPPISNSFYRLISQ